MLGSSSEFIAAVIVASLSLVGCAGSAPGTGQGAASQVLRVGLTANYPPLVDNVDGELQGLEIDLAREVGKDLGKRVEFVEIPWEQLIASLYEGKIDVIMWGMSVTKARSQKVAFAEPYMRIGQMAIIRIEDIQKLATVSALLAASGNVGYEEGTTGGEFVKNNMVNARPTGLGSAEQGVAALRGRAIDVFVHDAPTAWRIGSDPAYQDLIGLYWPLTQEHLAWAVRKSDDLLRDALSREVAAMRTDGRLAGISRRWIKVRVEVK
jgi:polar amino acid transport system substrate-binding protein